MYIQLYPSVKAVVGAAGVFGPLAKPALDATVVMAIELYVGAAPISAGS